MRSSGLISRRVGAVAAAFGLDAAGALASAPASVAFTGLAAGTPTAGVNCQASDGKLSGRGSTLQTWLVYDLMGAYSSDVCGPVAADSTANGGDITDPGSAIYNLTGGETYGADWMTAYNYPSAQILGSSGTDAAVGSGAGQTAIGCFSEAFGGTDIPVTSAQLSNINNGTYTTDSANSQLESNGKDCDPVSGSTKLTTPFSPLANSTATPFPNVGDSASLSPSGIMVFPIGISAVSTFANVPAACDPSGTTLTLSSSDEQNIWGGGYTNWDQVTDAGFPAGSPCTTAGGGVAITRVVRSDNSGTTQSMNNYLADINTSNYTTSTNGICSGNTVTTAATWQKVQNNQALNNTNAKNWPTGGSCSPLSDSQGAGGPALIGVVETTNGAVGYADLSDAEHDTNNFKSQVSGDVIAEFSVKNSSGTGESPRTSSGASNCTTSSSLPGGGTNGAVGLGGTWDLTAETAPNGGPADIGYAAESAYPICSLTWDMVWTGDDGLPAEASLATTGSATTAANSSTISIDPSSAYQGLPNSFAPGSTGSLTVGSDTINYTGVTFSPSVTAPTTITLTGVTGDSTAIPADTALNFPDGTGGPEANLTADQRRTLYSYFTYVESPAAQGTEAGAGYAALPASWQTTIREGFQANF
jgi:hypothetical protein